MFIKTDILQKHTQKNYLQFAWSFQDGLKFSNILPEGTDDSKTWSM